MSGVRSRWAAIGAAVAVTLGAGGLVSVSADSAESVFVAVTPTRVLDTRTGVGLSGVFVSDAGRKLDVTGTVAVVNADGSTGSRVVVPEGATAIVGNLTAVSPSSRGFVSIRPGTASGVPTTSNVNIPAPGVNVPNAVTVELPVSGPSAGRVDLFYRALDAGASTHLLLDIVGYYVAGQGTPGPQGPIGQAGPAGQDGADGVRLAGPLVTALTPIGSGPTPNGQMFQSVTIGAGGNPVISYWDYASNSLKVATCADPICTTNVTNTVDSPSTGGVGVGYFSSITIGTNGNPVISYFDVIGRLKIAACTNPVCSSSTRTVLDTITSGTTQGFLETTSIVIGDNGRPVVSYYDNANGDLKVAACANTTCTSATINPVDTAGDVGGYSAIALGADGSPVISYLDLTNGDLRLSVCGDPTCASSVNQIVDSVGHVGRDTSVAVGADGNPIISYTDDNGVLKVASCDDPTCASAVATSVDTDGEARFTSIAVSADGYPIVSYVDSVRFTLKVAVCLNLECTSSITSTLVPAVNTPRGTAITIGADGNPVITNAGTPVVQVYACGNVWCNPQIRVGR